MVKGNKLARIVASVALPVIGSINVGCEMTPAQEMAVGGVSARHIAATNPNLNYRQTQSLGAIGGLLGILAQQESAKEAEREVRPNNVSVEIISPETHPQHYNQNLRNNNSKNIRGWIRPNDSFVCSRYKDLNGDGYIGKNELIREGNYFKCGEEYTKDNPLLITIGSLWENMKGQTILTKIKRRGGENKTYIQEELLSSNALTDWNYMGFYKEEKDEGIEEWCVEFYKNGRLDSSKTLSFFIDYGKNE